MSCSWRQSYAGPSWLARQSHGCSPATQFGLRQRTGSSRQLTQVRIARLRVASCSAGWRRGIEGNGLARSNGCNEPIKAVCSLALRLGVGHRQRSADEAGPGVILRLDAIRQSYPGPSGQRVALDGVSLELERGQLMGIFGPSGAGKTTLLRIAAGLQRPDSGSVSYRGQRLEEMSAGERLRYSRREVACVWTGQPEHERLGIVDHVALPLL